MNRDSVGRATQDVGLEVLARFGLLLFYGDASGPPLPIDPDRLYERYASSSPRVYSDSE